MPDLVDRKWQMEIAGISPMLTAKDVSKSLGISPGAVSWRKFQIGYFKSVGFLRFDPSAVRAHRLEVARTPYRYKLYGRTAIKGEPVSRFRTMLREVIQEVVREEMATARHPEQLLTVEDLARIFNCSKAAAYVLSHRMPRFQVKGSHARFRPEDVKEFIRQNTKGGPRPPAPPRPRYSPKQEARIKEIKERLLRGVRCQKE